MFFLILESHGEKILSTLCTVCTCTSTYVRYYNMNPIHTWIDTGLNETGQNGKISRQKQEGSLEHWLNNCEVI